MTHLPHAPLFRRAAALCYELLLIGAVTVLTGLLAGGINTLIQQFLPALYPATPPLTSLLLLAAWWYYFKINWLREGQTLPMRIWRIGLVDSRSGRRPALKQYRLRFVWACILLVFLPLLAYAAFAHGMAVPPKRAAAVSLLWWILPWGFALLNARRQFLYDYLAGCELVDLRQSR